MPIIILPMHRDDIDEIAKLHAQAFPKQQRSFQVLYKKALNAEEVAVIKNLYSHDEVIMISRVLS